VNRGRLQTLQISLLACSSGLSGGRALGCLVLADLRDARPWSRRAELPRDRLGLVVCIWAEVTHREQFFDYSLHDRWTVEHARGLFSSLVPARARRCSVEGPALTRWL
jgi:hypothetical protein